MMTPVAWSVPVILAGLFLPFCPLSPQQWLESLFHLLRQLQLLLGIPSSPLMTTNTKNLHV